MVEIPHPTQAKVKFPTQLRNAFCLKIPSLPRHIQVIVKN